jgi:hypothetical protein
VPPERKPPALRMPDLIFARLLAILYRKGRTIWR